MHESGGKRCGYSERGAVRVRHGTGRGLGPFQQYPWTFVYLRREEPHVDCSALVAQTVFSYLNSGLAQHTDAAACHLRVRVAGADHHAADVMLAKHLGAGWSLAVMRAWFEGDIHRGLRYEITVAVGHAAHCIDFGVRLTAFPVPSLSDYPSVRADNNRADHRVGRSVARAVGCKLQGAPHVFLVCDTIIHMQTFYCSSG